jgi:hypothetical protein
MKIFINIKHPIMSMLFKKPLSEVEFSDIQKLQDDKIEESVILDYKKEMISENDLVKHITAFSNTSGGFLIFGIEESGRGGYPVSIPGIEAGINVERLEQIIISNIRPRIGVQFGRIPISDSADGVILIIRIPEGQNRPYCDMKSHRYYRRYNYEAKPMDEFEIESLYQKRFFGASKLAKYVEETISFPITKLLQDLPERIDGHIIITPLRIDDRIIDTSDEKQIKANFDLDKMRFDPNPKSYYLQGMAEPSRYGIKWSGEDPTIEVHRNGLVHFARVYGSFHENENTKLIEADTLAYDLLQTIQFADEIYSTYEFVGKVKIILRAINTLNSKIVTGGHLPHYEWRPKCGAEEICIEREWDSWRLMEDYLEIGKSIMDEFSNYYGSWRAGMFSTDDEDNIQFSK